MATTLHTNGTTNGVRSMTRVHISSESADRKPAATGRTVSQILSEDHSIRIRPGAKGQCPDCERDTFSVKADDSLGKCFHPGCGYFLTPESSDRKRGSIISRALMALYDDSHHELLALQHGQRNAYSYLRDERGIHPDVIALAMLGAVPSGGWKVEPHFQGAIADLDKALDPAMEKGKSRKAVEEQQRAKKALDDMRALQQRLHETLAHRAGWLIFFYTDANHRPVALRLRQPYAKTFVSFKPGAAGLFGREMYVPYKSPELAPVNEYLTVVEGEFNALQLQSLTVRCTEAGTPTKYLNVCAVGGVLTADVQTLTTVSKQLVVCYDNDANGAGEQLVDKIQAATKLETCTTPLPVGQSKSDLDSHIRSFTSPIAAWKSVETIMKSREALGRAYSNTGVEFFAEPVMGGSPTFTPKLLGDALTDRQTYRYTASQLWVYRNGVYVANGDTVLMSDAQGLLGEERRTSRIEEALHYVKVATNAGEAAEPEKAYINLRNGRLRWQTLTLEPHTAAVFSIAQLPMEYDPSATCPTFMQYLQTTLEEEDIPLIQEILGWCLVPDTRFERAGMFTGSGKNGKGVMLDAISWLLGEDNITNTALQDLEENRFRAAELYGKLANIFADLPDKRLQTSSMFKMLVSGDRIEVERKHQHPFRFRNYAKLIFSANALPATNDRTYAFYRRWLIIPFERTFNGEGGNPEPDMDLRAKLKEELPGILNYALEGLRRLYDRGDFTETTHTLKAKQAYMLANDSLQTFMEECVTVLPQAMVSKREFYAVYKQWCSDHNERYPTTEKQLKDALKKIIPTINDNRVGGSAGKWHWIGIGLNDEADAYRPHQRDERYSTGDDASVPF